MATYKDVVEEILSILQGYTLAPDQMTYLTSDLSADGLTLAVAAYNTGSAVNPGLGAGLVEVGDELVWIDNYDDATSTLTALPRGRGWRGTTPTAHTTGETVVISPLVPRHRVKAAINDVLAALWPSLYGVAQDEFTYSSGTQSAWPVPADAETVLDVRYRDRDNNWQRVRKWEVEHSPSGSEVRLCGVEHGATVRVVYGKRPSPFAAETDDFTTTGLPVSAKDVVVYGALRALIPALDAGRLGVQYVPADELDQPRQMGAAMSIAREFKQEYAAALQREQAALQNLYPARVHQTR
jgi:hypothetical protein